MRTLHKLASLAVVAAFPLFAIACGDDDDASDGAGATGGTGGSGGTAGTGGTGGSAGEGGTPTCDLSGTGKSHETIPNPTGNKTLTSDKIWDLSGTTYVGDGETLTIEPCTRIEGVKSPLGTLVVTRGGRIVADGTATSPILFTSKLPVGSRARGDWGGVILLGRAPNFQGDTALIEGLPVDPKNQHGGNNAADSSGSMKYVLIQFPGYELQPNIEVNGLTFGSVGSGTAIENVMVNGSADDCFEWFGGAVNAKFLVCQNSDDDMFDTDFGYEGFLQYVFGRHTIAPTESSNGIEAGYDNAVAITPSKNTKLNFDKATTCGFGQNVASDGFGTLLRNYIEGSETNVISNYVATGFDYGVNVQFTTHPNIAIRDSIFFGMFNSASDQIVNPSDDNTTDANFDEATWFTGGTNNSTTAPAFTLADCKDAAGPASSVKSSNVGAFKDNATWLDWIKPEWWASQ